MQQCSSTVTRVAIFADDRTGRLWVLLLKDELDLEVVRDDNVCLFLRRVAKFQPQVAILGQEVDDKLHEGLEILSELIVLDPAPQCIVVGSDAHVGGGIAAFRSGAAGYLTLDEAAQPGRLAQYIRDVVLLSSSDIPLSASPLTDVASSDLPAAGSHNPLTRREREVLGWMGVLNDRRAVAERLHIAVGTVRATLRNIYDKMPQEYRRHYLAVDYALDRQWIVLPDSGYDPRSTSGMSSPSINEPPNSGAPPAQESRTHPPQCAPKRSTS